MGEGKEGGQHVMFLEDAIWAGSKNSQRFLGGSPTIRTVILGGLPSGNPDMTNERQARSHPSVCGVKKCLWCRASGLGRWTVNTKCTTQQGIFKTCVKPQL